jgi:hypothetical protein
MPKAQRTITDSKFGWDCETLALKLLEQFTRGFSTFPVTINDGYQLLGAILKRSHENQHTAIVRCYILGPRSDLQK